jgi:hypothetical protein
LNPISGQPLRTGEEPPMNWAEVINLTIVIAAIAVVFAVLIKKRIL